MIERPDRQRDRKRTWLWWSSGKDSAWTLHTLRRSEDFAVEALVTTVNAAADRVAMHAVRSELLRAQARAVDLPVHVFEIPYPCPNGAYEEAARNLIAQAEREGVSHMAFGDLFLEDIRAYREDLFAHSPIDCVFPLWKRDTHALALEMIDAGLSAYLTCVDPKVLDPSYVGRRFDRALLEDLPPGVDPCGENGEFHTFVHASPDFTAPIEVEVGDRLERDGFWFVDLQ